MVRRFARLTAAALTSLLVMTGSIAAQSSGFSSNDRKVQLRNIFVNMTGDAKLDHRFWSFLDFELEDIGIQLTSTEKDADVFLNGKVEPLVTKTDFGLGVVQMQVTKSNQVQKINTCASLSTDKTAQLFRGESDSLAQQIRHTYPDARTVSIDPESNLQASDNFSTELANSLKKSGFEMGTPHPELSLRVDLVPTTVAMEETLVKYEISVYARDGGRPLFSESGTGVLSIKLAGEPPDVCPDRVGDLDMLANDDPIFRLVRSVLKDLKKHRAL